MGFFKKKENNAAVSGANLQQMKKAAVQSALQDMDLNYQFVNTDDGRCAFKFGFKFEKMSVTFFVILSENGALEFISDDIAKLQDGVRAGVLDELNRANSDYRFGKYYITPDGGIRLQQCVSNNIAPEKIADEIKFLIVVSIRILEDDYAKIMKANWK